MARYNVKVGISIATGPSPNVEVAALADSLGYDSIWVGDHVGFDRYEFEALTMLTAYAMVTRHVSLGVGVLVLPLRQPVVLAKTCASIDQLAHGRLILGVGAGGDFPEQYPACGVEYSKRGRMADEGIAVLRQLWRENSVSFDGDCYRLENVTVQPKSFRPEGIPFWVGGRSSAAMRRAGRLGNGYIPFYVTPAMYREAWMRVCEEAQRSQRECGSITPAVLTWLGLADTREAACAVASRYQRATLGTLNDDATGKRHIDKYYVLGSAADCLERLREYADAGVRHFVLRLVSDIDGVAEQARRVAEEVLPEMRRW